MNVAAWKAKNRVRKFRARLTHPWPLYKRSGGISAVVIRANGDRENLGCISDTYLKRRGWSVGSGNSARRNEKMKSRYLKILAKKYEGP